MTHSSSFSLTELFSSDRFAVCRDKEYYEKSWQKGKSYDYCQQQLKIGKPNGYGLLTGEFNGVGIVSIDFDGDSADQVAKAIGSWLLNQDSMCWSSGKKGHYQIAYQIPTEHLALWQHISKYDLTKYKNYSAINGDHLEIRYKGHASVLPPSVHPETGYYKWINEIPPRCLSFQESYDLLNTCLIFIKDNDLSPQDELRMIEVALSHIPSDDYHTWVTVGMALYNHGVDFDVWDRWSATSAKYNGKGIEKKWDSFKKGYKVGIGTLFYLAKNNGFNQSQWMRENLKRNVTILSKTYEKSGDDINENNVPFLFEQLVNKLAQPEINESQRFLEIGQFCTQYKVAPNSLVTAIKTKIERENKTIELENVKSNLDDLINVPNEQLDLSYIFGNYFAEYIKESAKEIPTNPDAIVTIFLPVLASVIGTRSRIIVNPNTRYIVPFIIRSMIVARSGNKKSPTARLAVDPLQDINLKYYQQYKKELADYNELSGDEKKTTPKPVQKRTITQDSTFDGLIKIHAENPQGFLCYVDELAGYFKRMNKFYNGDDVQRDLELYEGKQLIKTRASEESTFFLERTAISVTGTIQEVALKEILNNELDLTGISARWIIWAGKMPLGRLTERSEENNNTFSDAVSQVIDILLDMNINSDLLIDDTAYEMFRQWQHGVMDCLQDLSLPQLENKHSKIESDVIKFAGVLHYLFSVMGSELITNEIVINCEIMARAITLGNYYLRHFAYIVTKCQEGMLNSQLLKILELLKKKGEITSTDVKRFIWEFKSVPNGDINELLLSLVELGKAQQIPTKKGIKIKLM
ncbi:DUF3987 domain-containing protein [Cyanobacterium aponinum AL20118]|uniref:DUF3987 domain-containing protein n=1 Tax=Cyanobacterium aponinum AL20115 TaxID=3090662 RepID=A0AAF0ZHH3_9CHRO|nr:DUF3987 domain-containing protein [Cyanobacterium aponinum]WPF89419.1 DUF3987 domain-containing protein [Cyanobacterium aponinum AL20115]